MRRTTESPLKQVTVVGAGGNIGSFLSPLLARQPGIGKIVLIDPDTYERKNLQGQDITPEDVGRLKVDVQEERIHCINPDIQVVTIPDYVENVPLGLLRSDIIIGCLDSLLARQITSEKAWMLGIPFVDGGVLGEQMLSRVTTYIPSRETSCLQCPWTAATYEALPQRFPCHDDENPETNAPPHLGSLTASLLANECHRVLTSDDLQELAGRQILMDISRQHFYVTSQTVNKNCLMPNHNEEPIRNPEPLPEETTLNQLFEKANGSGDVVTIEVPMQKFATTLTCMECGSRFPTFFLKASLDTGPSHICASCGGEVLATGFGLKERLEAVSMLYRDRHSTFRSVGIRVGDIVEVAAKNATKPTEQAVTYYEVTRANGGSRPEPS